MPEGESGPEEGAAPGKLTDGGALQGLRVGSAVCQHDLLTLAYPASWRLCAHAGTHIHRLPGVALSDPSLCVSVGPGLTLSLNIQIPRNSTATDTRGEKERCRNRNLRVCVWGGRGAVTSTCGNRLMQTHMWRHAARDIHVLRHVHLKTHTGHRHGHRKDVERHRKELRG